MNYTYQCGHRHCRQRYQFARPLESYQRRPTTRTRSGYALVTDEHGRWVCGRCKQGTLHETNKFIKAWNRRRPKRETCNCPGYRGPHELGYGQCIYNPANLQDDDLILEEAVTVANAPDPPW